MNREPQLIEDTVRQYLNEAGREDLLTKEQEADLSKRMLAGKAAQHLLQSQESVAIDENLLEQIKEDGMRSRERLIDANLRLAVSYAAKHYRKDLEYLDRIQHANQGLIRAVDKFDYKKGYKFSTYATWWIRQSLQRGAAKEAHTVRLPVKVRELLAKKKKVEEEALKRDEKLTENELAEKLDISVQRLRYIVLAPRFLDSLDKPVGRDGSDERLVADFVPDESSMYIQEEVVEGLWRKQILKEAAGLLNDRELFILKSRFGFHNGEPHTLEETGDAMGLTRERVRQIQKQAVEKLQEYFVGADETRKAA